MPVSRLPNLDRGTKRKKKKTFKPPLAAAPCMHAYMHVSWPGTVGVAIMSCHVEEEIPPPPPPSAQMAPTNVHLQYWSAHTSFVVTDCQSYHTYLGTCVPAHPLHILLEGSRHSLRTVLLAEVLFSRRHAQTISLSCLITVPIIVSFHAVPLVASFPV